VIQGAVRPAPGVAARRRPAWWPAGLGAAAVALFALIPFASVVARAAGVDAAVWSRVVTSRLPGLLARTSALVVTSTALAVAIGVPLAWLVARSDLPGRGVISWLGVLPLAIPPYVGSLAYLAVFGPGGLVGGRIFGLLGATIGIGLFTFPYVFALTADALRRVDPSLEEAARSMGAGPVEAFFRATLPAVRPATLTVPLEEDPDPALIVYPRLHAALFGGGWVIPSPNLLLMSFPGDPLSALAHYFATQDELGLTPSTDDTARLGALWAEVITLLRTTPARWSAYQLRDIAGRLDALGMLDPTARTFEMLDELAPDLELLTVRQGYPEHMAEIVLALARHDERRAFETLMHSIGGPCGMTMDEAWDGTRRRMGERTVTK
jgi:ABC-type nitrate/sulfonate/bicarbonate transport system permease component